MRTVELDDDLIANAEAIAREQGKTVDEIVASLAWQGLQANGGFAVRNGARLLIPLPGRPQIDLEFVNALRDEES